MLGRHLAMRIVPPHLPVPEAGPPLGGAPTAGAASGTPENVAPQAAPADRGADDDTSARPSLSIGTSHANLVGHVLADRYRLLKLIGEGGMGSVYQAEHITIGRKLAIKVLAPEYCDSPEVVARFLQEARTASMLHHEHIVDITDFGYTKQGLAFLTMEYLEGEDLATLLQREGRQPWARLRRMILQVCRALHAAHEKGIVHRDMKPDNCFRIKRGGNHDFIKILDFGIAKVIADGQFGSREDKPKMATEAGTLLGTPEYMAPEIARDQKADARVDVYSLGILMYEMLTGSVPFKGHTFMATVAMQMVDEPDPPSLRCPEASIPPEIEHVILIALRKDPADRYQSVHELAEALIDADRALRMTSQGLPALHFESGEYASSITNPGASESSMLRSSQLRDESSMLRTSSSTAGNLANSGRFPAHRSGSGPSGPAGTTGTTGNLGPAGTGAHRALTPQPLGPESVATDAATALDLDDGSAMTRPNPYRALSVLLLLVILGLGGSVYYLLGHRVPAPETPENGEILPAVDTAGNQVPVPSIPADAKNPSTPPPANPTGDTPDEPTKPERPKKIPQAAPTDASDAEKQTYINTLLADVSRCATANQLPRQQVSFLLEIEESSGKVKANLESPQGNAAFASCAEKAIEKKRFKKGRKYMTFHANLKL